MFNLIPWKKRRGKLAVRRDEPLSDEPRGYAPWMHLREEFETLMDRFMDESRLGTRRFGDGARLPAGPRFAWNWDLGWRDAGQEFVFESQLPGFEPDDIDIQVRGNLLTVIAEDRQEKQENGGTSYRYGSYRRTLPLPHGVEADQLEARYHSGVLEIHLPKTAAAIGKRVEVQSG